MFKASIERVSLLHEKHIFFVLFRFQTFHLHSMFVLMDIELMLCICEKYVDATFRMRGGKLFKFVITVFAHAAVLCGSCIHPCNVVYIHCSCVPCYV